MYARLIHLCCAMAGGESRLFTDLYRRPTPSCLAMVARQWAVLRYRGRPAGLLPACCTCSRVFATQSGFVTANVAAPTGTMILLCTAGTGQVTRSMPQGLKGGASWGAIWGCILHSNQTCRCNLLSGNVGSARSLHHVCCDDSVDHELDTGQEKYANSQMHMWLGQVVVHCKVWSRQPDLHPRPRPCAEVAEACPASSSFVPSDSRRL